MKIVRWGFPSGRVLIRVTSEPGEKTMSQVTRHAPPTDKRGPNQELLYDPNVPTPSHAEQARTLVEKMSTGTLCTLFQEPAGYPYGSFVTYALYQGDPLFFVSALAEHTKNLHGSERASLLVAEAGAGNPLALGRVTLLGDCHRVNENLRDELKEIFVAKNPPAKFYIDFKDFSFWRLQVTSLRYIGGFGRMSWVQAGDWRNAEPDPIAPGAQAIIEHMNEDHRDTMLLYCRTLSKATDTEDAQLVGVDRYGFEMSALTQEGPRPIRLAFSKPLANAHQVRDEMMALAKRARAI
jgi:heme iron utilization protein